jgi:ketosteroid isomerase-like protein
VVDQDPVTLFGAAVPL